MDGYSTHMADKVLVLAKNNVKVLFVPPHSTHLTQPLDVLTFGLCKTQMKKITFSHPYCDHSKRILKGIKGTQMVCNQLDFRSAFLRAGIVINVVE